MAREAALRLRQLQPCLELQRAHLEREQTEAHLGASLLAQRRGELADAQHALKQCSLDLYSRLEGAISAQEIGWWREALLKAVRGVEAADESAGAAEAALDEARDAVKVANARFGVLERAVRSQRKRVAIGTESRLLAETEYLCRTNEWLPHQ